MTDTSEALAHSPGMSLPHVWLADWAETVPAHGLCTFELQRGAMHWSAEPASWRPERDMTQTSQRYSRYIVIKVDHTCPQIDSSTKGQLGAVAEMLTDSVEGAPAWVW